MNLCKLLLLWIHKLPIQFFLLPFLSWFHIHKSSFSVSLYSFILRLSSNTFPPFSLFVQIDCSNVFEEIAEEDFELWIRFGNFESRQYIGWVSRVVNRDNRKGEIEFPQHLLFGCFFFAYQTFILHRLLRQKDLFFTFLTVL